MELLTGTISTLSRQHLQVRGIVQGVGFRPFVFNLASQFNLAGFVCNDGTGVAIEIEGASSDLNLFMTTLYAQAPTLAAVESVTKTKIPLKFEQTFTILPSKSVSNHSTLISPDAATCDTCLREMLNPNDRRFRYPFINCTNCGPRFTIIQDVPYDRAETTMRLFRMCPTCQSEYENPFDRRFHAQPNACPICGPALYLQEVVHKPTANGRGYEVPSHSQISGDAALRQALHLLAEGKIVAIKGLGGYHLACDAFNETAVTTLRSRKHREAKPFALMVRDLETARQLCYVTDAEAQLLQSRRRPIVLLRQRPSCPIPSSTAPNYHTLGLMLPYTPLHTLLFERAFDGRHPFSALVMTSGNIRDEPIAFRDEEAQERLAVIADTFLGHNREIFVRCDDSVTAILDLSDAASINAKGKTNSFQLMLRRSRGYVPEPIHLKRALLSPVLAVGGHLKNTFCLGKGKKAFVSHHIGDLENLETLQSFEDGISHFTSLFDIQPEYAAHDLHPNYMSTKWALDRFPCIAVQHHHAHIVSVMAEHGLDGRVIGVAADGTGYGADGAVWGGEVMVAGLDDFVRTAHLAYVPLPGGGQAIRQPWRMAAVYLRQAFGDEFLDLEIPFVQQLDRLRWHPLERMIVEEFNSPPTSSLGRLFDAVSCLLMGRNEVVYEGQAAIELEMAAVSASAVPIKEAYPFAVLGGEPLQMDVRPLIRAVVEEIGQGTPVPLIAGRFHRTIAAMITAVCQRIQTQTSLTKVALSGGVFQNRLLLSQLLPMLATAGFQAYINHQVPANDGGLSLGQVAVAAARLENGEL